jgi:hypothetical protein
MRFSHSRFVCLAMLVCVFAVCRAQTANPSRITQRINSSQPVRLAASVHPLARPKFDEGVFGLPIN